MTVEIVRTIIADPYQFDRAEGTGDGVTRAFPLPNGAIKDGSFIVSVNGVEVATPADYEIDLTLGLMTFVIAPADGVQVVATYQFSLLTDADIQVFLDLNGDSNRLGAADALDTIASSEALIQKRMTILDLQTDGKAVADALRAHAKNLRAQADDELEEEDDLFDYAEMQFQPFGRIPWARRP